MCRIGPEPRLRHWLRPWDSVGSLDVPCLMVPVGGSEVPIPPQQHGGGWNNGTLEFELHVPNWPRTTSATLVASLG
jgi:hypothetical protein